MNSDRIPNFDIQVSTLEDSIGITSMNWIQAQTERWCTSPINNVKPNLAMLSSDGYIIPKNIYNYPWHPVRSRNDRTKEHFHSCFITFDRAYVIWWYSNSLGDLIAKDFTILHDIGLVCSGGDVDEVRKLPLEELTIKDLRPIVDNLGYRIHKKEASRIKLKESASFKII